MQRLLMMWLRPLQDQVLRPSQASMPLRILIKQLMKNICEKGISDHQPAIRDTTASRILVNPGIITALASACRGEIIIVDQALADPGITTGQTLMARETTVVVALVVHGIIAVQAQASTAPGIVVPETTTTAATSICHGEITIAAQTLVPGVIMVMVAGSAGNKLAGAVLSMHAPALI